jgi:hypothetical protein
MTIVDPTREDERSGTSGRQAVVDGPIEPSGDELTEGLADPLRSAPSISPIVVGISRRSGSLDALRWSVAEAQMRGAQVVAVTAWRGPRSPGVPGGRSPTVLPDAAGEAFGAEQRRIEAILVKALGGTLADWGVSFSLRRGAPAAVLLSAAVGAQLLVLDSPRAGSIVTLPKSWIVPQIVARCPCPVVLMPPPLR